MVVNKDRIEPTQIELIDKFAFAVKNANSQITAVCSFVHSGALNVSTYSGHRVHQSHEKRICRECSQSRAFEIIFPLRVRAPPLHFAMCFRRLALGLISTDRRGADLKIPLLIALILAPHHEIK
jgi:hypothetical protein